MPGSSLWLVPPEDSSLYKTLHSLILTAIPAVYPTASPPPFTPHITLTADTVLPDTEPSQPQHWLDSIPLPETGKLQVSIREAQVGQIFFQKLTMRCEKTAELCALAAHCRAAGVRVDVVEAEEWVREKYRPHCSLLYSDLPEEEVHSKLEEVHAKVREVQNSDPECCSAKGGSIWLVPTFNGIDDWKPIANRELPDIEWIWS